jgi:hypothetical protein
MSASSYLQSRSPDIRVVCPAAVPTWTVFMGTSSGCTWGAQAEPHRHKLDGARS